MNALQWAGRLYSLDTLDTRFTAFAKTSVSNEGPSTVPNGGRKNARDAVASKATPSRWRTPEFGVYALVFAFVVPLMFKSVIDISKRA